MTIASAYIELYGIRYGAYVRANAGTLSLSVFGKKKPGNHFVPQTMALRCGFQYMIGMHPFPCESTATLKESS